MKTQNILTFLIFWFTVNVACLSQAPPPRIVHLFVALADNQSQGIVPVPARLGNGEDPGHNLYWGSAYGVRTFFIRSEDWALVTSS